MLEEVRPSCTTMVIMLYDTGMTTMAVSEAREKLSDAVEAARTEPVFLERYGQPAAVLVSPERYEELMEALEDAEDAAAFDAAMAEDAANIPWDQVKADLGWT
jgi:antitoxin Phd